MWLTKVVIPLCLHCRSWSHNYSEKSFNTSYRNVKKVCNRVNICSLWASVYPDSQAASRRISQCGHNESIGREINCTNLLLDNTIGGWWRRMNKGWWLEEENDKTFWETGIGQKWDEVALEDTRVCICTHGRSLCGRHHNNIISYWLLTTRLSLYNWAVRPCKNSIQCEPDRLQWRKHLQSVLRKMNSGALRGLRQPAPLIWLVVAKWLGATWVTGMKSACHRKLKSALRCPAETPSSEQKCDRKPRRRTEQTEAAEERELPHAAFYGVISFFHLKHHLSLSAHLSLVIC